MSSSMSEQLLSPRIVPMARPIADPFSYPSPHHSPGRSPTGTNELSLSQIFSGKPSRPRSPREPSRNEV